MKKYIAIIFLLFSFIACEDYLEEKTVTTLTQSFYNTAEGLDALVKGSYQLLRFKPDYNHGHYLFGSSNDVEVFIQSDNDRVAMGSYAIDAWGADVVTGVRMTPAVTPLLGWIGGDWSEGMYPVINRCNLFLENYGSLSADDQLKIKARKGEMLFMRAYSYYLLTNVLGDVPLILKSFQGMPENFYFPKAPMEDIYKVMISDLREAVTLLPETINTATELGRITKPAAAHLLAKIYLNRAQAAGLQNNAEIHLRMLYKGNVSTDLDSSIYYATVVIDQLKGNSAYGGLEPDFGSLWTIEPTNASALPNPAARETRKELILSTQYEPTLTYNGRYGCVLVHVYASDHTSLRACTPRNLTYSRPYRALGTCDWTFDMYPDRANDSRYYKTFLTDYVATDPNNAGGKPWDAPTAYYYNAFLKDQYGGDTAVVSTVSKIKYPNRSIVYIENKKEEPLDSLFVVSQPYIMMVRWIVGSPNQTGYFTKDASGKITGFKPGAAVDPSNPVITNITGRKLMYRQSGDRDERFGIDRSQTVCRWYLCPKKWLDRNRGRGTDPNGNGGIDIVLIRLAETYLIRAEAYGRKGDFAAAIDDINVLRKRAAYHANENRSDVLVTLEPGVITGSLDVPSAEKVAPYKVVTDSYEKIRVDGTEWQAGTERARKENYPPLTGDGRALTDMDRFIHFIYNEKAREHCFELMITEDLHNAGILWERVHYREMMGAPASSTGTEDFPFPVDQDDVDRGGSIGALGYGKGQFDKHHTFKAWPNDYLDLLTDEQGNSLTQANKQAYQNQGY